MSPAEFRVIIVFEVLPKEIKKQKQTLNPSFSTSTLLSQRWSAIPLVDIWDVFSQLVLQLSMRFHRYQVLTRCSTDYQQRSRLRCVLDPALDVHARLTHHGIWTTQRRGTWSVNRPAHISMNCGNRVRGFCPRHHSRTGYYRSVLIQIRLTQKRFTFLSVIKKTVKCSYKQINKTKWEFNSKTKTISCKKLCFPTVRQNKVNSVNIKFFFFKFRKTLKCNPQC